LGVVLPGEGLVLFVLVGDLPSAVSMHVDIGWEERGEVMLTLTSRG
jgi:hypothetical protein